MAFDLPDGKKARNIQEQVAFLTEKVRELIAFVNQAGLKSIQIVDELPAVGDPTVLYLLQKEDPEEGNYYEEYLWIDNAWELIGTTEIDLSDYCTLSTDQTITGEKTFKNHINIISDNENYNFEIGSLGGDGLLTFKRGTSSYALALTATIVYARTIIPAGNNTMDLGSSSFTWKDLYLSGTANIDKIRGLTDSATGFDISSGANRSLGHFYPNANATYSLGAAALRWKDLYLSGKINLNYAYIEADSSYFSVKKTSDDSNLLFADTSACYIRRLLPINATQDLGSTASGRQWRNLYLGGYLSDANSANYGLVLPDTTGWTANKTIATTDQLSSSGLYQHDMLIKLQGSSTFSLAYSVRIINSYSSPYTATTSLARLAAGSGDSEAYLYKMEANMSGETTLIRYIVLKYYYSGSGTTVTLTIADDTLTISTLNIVEISDAVTPL